VLDAAFATARGLRPSGGRRIVDAAGSAIPFGIQQSLTLRIGDVALPRQDAAVLPLPNPLVDRGRRPRLAGLIGLNGFGHSIIRIEWAARRLELLADDAEPDPAGTSLPLATRLAFGPGSATGPQWLGATVSATLDGTQLDLGLDTGFAGIVRLNESFVQQQDLLNRYEKHIDFLGPGRRPSLSMTMARRLGLGGVSIEQPVVAMSRAPAPDNFMTFGLGLDQRRILRPDRPGPAGALGFAALLHYKPFIDIAGQRLVLEPRVIPLPSGRKNFRDAGLLLDKPEHDAFTVSAVAAGTPAAQAGIIPGDQITSVNGVPATDLAVFDYARLEAAGPVKLQFATGPERTLSAAQLLP